METRSLGLLWRNLPEVNDEVTNGAEATCAKRDHNDGVASSELNVQVILVNPVLCSTASWNVGIGVYVHVDEWTLGGV